MSNNNDHLEVGTRITVYSSDDDQWYRGTVASAPNEDDDDDNRFLIEYDDGDTAWLDKTESRWRRSTKQDTFIKHDTLSKARKQERIKKLHVGSRISIWWPHEKEYYTGTLTRILDDDSDKKISRPHHIFYDDGDEDLVNLLYCKFKRVPKKSDRLDVGSRVSVYFKDKDRNYPGTVTKIRPDRAKPHRVKFDDTNKGKQWFNLNVHPFLDMVRPLADASTRVNAMTLKKRKREFMKPQAPDTGRPQKRAREDDIPLVKKCNEICGICKSRAKRARATSCHHIFCKICIDTHHENNKFCPLCKAHISGDRTKYDPDHASFKAVEALDRKTGDVVKSFSTASASSLKYSRLVPSRIIEACQSKRRDDREHRGYYWRFQGSKDRILRVGEGVKDGIPIEQVSLETGEIIQIFASTRKADEKTGIGRGVIRRVLNKRGKADGGGFFWRFQGETHGPWPDPKPTNLNPVEKLDFKTGDFLESYDSLADAKRAMGMQPNAHGIRKVCDGLGRATAKGFFWRWKGSKALPNHMMGAQKIIQIRTKKRGKVVKEFRNSKEAQLYFGYQCCWSTICRYCREKGFYNGYYWKYRMLTKRKSIDEEIIGRRLRVKQTGNAHEWLEGKINAFDSDTGRHEILYDNGTIEHCKLSEIVYKWKNDQGQKAVEQLDLKTGEVIATFSSMADAIDHLGDSASKSHISAVCTGRCKSSSGFFWRYKGSDALPPKEIVKRKVEQFCLKTGRVIATHDSITAAGKAVGITTPGISYCCNGRNNSKSAGGFGWRFTKDEDTA